MPADDPRVKRVLKRYLKGAEFADAGLELAGIDLEELAAMCRCATIDFKAPLELNGYGLVNFTNRMGISFDGGQYDYIVHSYARREFCSSERVPEEGINFPCEDGPPAKIPLQAGMRWVSTRPIDGEENYVGVEDDNSQTSV